MQKVWKSVKIWQSYREYEGGNFFETQCIIMCTTIAFCDLYFLQNRVLKLNSLADRRCRCRLYDLPRYYVFFFRKLPSSLTELNSTKICNMFESMQGFEKRMSKIWDKHAN